MTLRDSLKTKEYFIKKIKETERLLEKRKVKLRNNLIPTERIQIIKVDMVQQIVRKSIALYSVGVPITEVKDSLKQAINIIHEYWAFSWDLFDRNEVKLKQYGGSEYNILLSTLSMSYLFGDFHEYIKKIKEVLRKDEVVDLIYEFILDASLNDYTSTFNESYSTYFDIPHIYSTLRKAIGEEDQAVCEKLIKNFLENEWYQNLAKADIEPAEAHKSKHDIYYGYWCFEAAAVTCIKGLDDSSYRDHPYYPKDLADYYRAQQVNNL